MSIDPPSAPPHFAGPPPIVESLDPSRVNASSFSNSVSMSALERAGWIDGKVETMLPGGAIRIATELGRLTFTLAPPQFEQGTPVRISLDRASGRILLHPAAEQPAQSTISSPKFTTIPPSQLDRLIPLSVHDVAPVAIGAGGATLPQSTQALSVIFPHSNSPAFAVIAAFFPFVLRSGAVDKLSGQQTTRYAAGSRLAQMAGAARVSALEHTENGESHLRWTMPYFSEGAAHYAEWRQSRKDKDAQGPARTHIFLQVAFDFSGIVQIDALQIGDSISVCFVCETKIPAELMNDIRTTAQTLATRFGMQLNFTDAYGSEHLQKPTEKAHAELSDK